VVGTTVYPPPLPPPVAIVVLAVAVVNVNADAYPGAVDGEFIVIEGPPAPTQTLMVSEPVKVNVF
jgi:hypothetical protein